jgi:hypothetical protein
MPAIKRCFEKRVLDPRIAQAHYLFLVMLYSSSPGVTDTLNHTCLICLADVFPTLEQQILDIINESQHLLFPYEPQCLSAPVP